jgi:hypothetical protein
MPSAPIVNVFDVIVYELLPLKVSSYAEMATDSVMVPGPEPAKLAIELVVLFTQS